MFAVETMLDIGEKAVVELVKSAIEGEAKLTLAPLLSPILEKIAGLGKTQFENYLKSTRHMADRFIPLEFDEYRELIITAAEICIDSVDLFISSYDSSEMAQGLTDEYINSAPSLGEKDSSRIAVFLPPILERAIKELQKSAEMDTDFQIQWKQKSIQYREDILKRLTALERMSPNLEYYTEENKLECSQEYIDCWDAYPFLEAGRSMPKRRSSFYQIPSLNGEDLEEYLTDFLRQNSSDRERMLVILGEPGGGKTMSICYLLAHFSQHRKTYRVFRFSDIDENVWCVNSHKLTRRMLDSLGLSEEGLNDSVLVLDGLDEVILHSSYEDFLNQLQLDLGKNEKIQNFNLIVTSRRTRIHDISALKCPYISLLPMTPDQIIKFAEEYLDVERQNSPYIRRIDNALKQNKSLKDVLGIPIILYMILAQKININKDITLEKIYRRLFSTKSENCKNSIYYRCYDKTNHKITEKFPEQIHAFSKNVALTMWSKCPSKITLSEHDCQEISSHYLIEGYSYQDLLIGQYLHIGQNQMLSFVHRSIYEYFVALSFYESLRNVRTARNTPTELFEDHSCMQLLWDLGRITGIRDLGSYPEICQYIVDMMNADEAGFPKSKNWWKEFIQIFVRKGLPGNSSGQYFSGQSEIRKEVIQFFNLLWIAKEQLLSVGNQKKIDLLGPNCNVVYLYLTRFIQINFSRMIFHNIHMTYSILEGADFREAEFISGKFSFSDMRNLYAYNVILTGADLEGADLREAILEGATLNGAVLKNANLEGAKLKGAHIEGTIWDGAIMPDGQKYEDLLEKEGIDGLNKFTSPIQEKQKKYKRRKSK